MNSSRFVLGGNAASRVEALLLMVQGNDASGLEALLPHNPPLTGRFSLITLRHKEALH
jgi:hypothetical protein